MSRLHRHGVDPLRRAGLRAFAEDRGWTYVEDGDPCSLVDWPHGVTTVAKPANLMWGPSAGRVGVAFDYVGGGGVHDAMIVALRLPRALPWLFVDPLHFATDEVHMFAGRAFGTAETESDEFNRHFRVRTDDPRLASEILTPRTMALLLERGSVMPVAIEADYLFTWHHQMSPADVDARLGDLGAMLDHVPAFVWQE